MIGVLFKSTKLILASASPRRKELLAHLGIPFEVRKIDFNEEPPDKSDPREIALFLANSKAGQARVGLREGEVIITADTIVWCDGRLLNKPSGREEALEMLHFLSGKTHRVITGVCLLSGISCRSFYSETLVTFKNLTSEEIVYYVDNFKPYDKAGAYGIQEWIGYIGVERIEGSYFNVMGLPVQKLYCEITKFIQNNFE